MQLVFSRNEFEKLREIISNSKNQNIIEKFNDLFALGKREHVTTEIIDSSSIRLTFEENISNDIIDVILKFSMTNGELFSSTALSIPQLIISGKSLIKDLKEVVKK